MEKLQKLQKNDWKGWQDQAVLAHSYGRKEWLSWNTAGMMYAYRICIFPISLWYLDTVVESEGKLQDLNIYAFRSREGNYQVEYYIVNMEFASLWKGSPRIGLIRENLLAYNRARESK